MKEVYGWFINKMATMGMLSKRELDAENLMLNPLSKRMGTTINKMIRQKVQSFLVNEEETNQWHKEMFEEEEYMPAERSMHKSIPPANIRIQNFQRKQFD